jgi:type II secretory ATPase GspE/PulE/Tfp pilus assembly ATPase PilB-like protein
MVILAAVGLEPTLSVNLVKIGVVVALLFLWGLALQWVDRDTDVVKTKREQWNLITISGGMTAFFVLLVPPWPGQLFFVGVGAWLVLAGGAVLAYVFHRNGRVLPANRVLTAAHFKRLTGGEAKKRPLDEKGQRVRLGDAKGKFMSLPDDVDEAKDYQAVQDFMHDLLWRRASDVDMVAAKDKYRLMYRIDGVPQEKAEGVALEQGERVIRYLKKLAGLNVEEIRRPQTGRIKAALLSHNGEIGFTEVRTSGTTAGERIQLHIQSGPVLRRIHELGIAPQRIEALKEMIAKPTGMLLISAPPHNGLTTTQYAILRSHDAYIQNINTLERRRLVELDNITQRTYEGTSADVNYARMLQSILRREPDIVMVSECEDRETAQIATRAAAEDRKIYMGIIAKDSFDALAKYLAFVEDNRLAGKALVGVLQQKLIRVLCTACRESFRPDPATLKKLNLPADKIECFHRPPTKPLVDKKGREIVCPTCQGSGYVGRTGLFELLVIKPDVAELITEGAPINRIKSQCRKNRMYYLQEEGLLKVIDGTTSINEILRGTAPSPNEARAER